MPLISTGADAVLEPGVGLTFPMTTETGNRVWVIVTGECLQAIEESSVPDQFSGTNTFIRNRKLIEGSASAKYDSDGIDPAVGRREGSPFLIVRSDDLPNLEHH
jgi:hypothetical protein